MYVYYILRGYQKDILVEAEGDIDEETFPGIQLDDAPTVITAAIQKAKAEGNSVSWEECDLTDSFFNQEDNYINFNGRWIRRSDAPWRKDRDN